MCTFFMKIGQSNRNRLTKKMENVSTASQSFLNILTLFGLFPMSFVGKSRDCAFKINPISVIISLLSLTLLILAFIVNFKKKEFMFTDSWILLRSWDWAKSTEILCHIFLLCYQIYKRKNIVKFLMQVDDADQKVIR